MSLRLGVLSFFFLPAVAGGAPPAVPFVAGFERFARHEELGPATAGRLLLTELSCTACHAGHLEPKRGPQLNGAGSRLRPGWMKRFLASPQTAKPGTTMPNIFAGWPESDKRHAVESLVAYLGSLREEDPEIKGSGLVPVPFEFWNKGNAERGRRLYHQIGCIACHEPDADYEITPAKPSALDQLLEQLDPQELEELGLSGQARRVESIPLGELSAKSARKSLTHFLLDPEKARPAGRMPSFKLAVMEAADIAAYLLREQTVGTDESITETNESKIATGRRLFVELRCNNCHLVSGLEPARPGKPLSEISFSSAESCLGKPKRGLPHFSLDEIQTAAVKRGAAQQAGSAETTPADRLEFHLLQRNCYACHDRDNRGGVGRFRKPYFETVGQVDIGDEGRLPPPLTGVGRKLLSAWMNKVLKGTGDVRPHMRIRMPVFPAEAVKPLPALFAQVDRPAKLPGEREVFGNLEGLADAGRALLDTGCVECHSFRGESLPGVVGIDLEGITDRVQPAWFRDFLLNPGGLKPRTRMPTFFPGGKSQNPNVLAGEPDRQIAAMWAYLKVLDKQPLPAKIEAIRSQDFELKPKDRPIVLRTFMQEAGTHAIAVGFPERVHFAFDAETCRLAAAWKGRFLDAQGTWFSRFTPPAEPLGEDLIKLPEGLPFAILKEGSEPWPQFDPISPISRYLGYRLDDKGVPTFLYRYERYDIEDRIEPEAGKGLKRRLTIKNRKPEEKVPKLWFRPIAGKTLEQLGSTAPGKPLVVRNDAGLTMMIPADFEAGGFFHIRESGREHRIPLVVSTEQTIEVRYQW